MTAEVLNIEGGQAIRLPDGFHIDAESVSIRREGEAIILEPVKASQWPTGFFEAIHVDDPQFARPDQGQPPPAPSLA